MDFSIPSDLRAEVERFREFLRGPMATSLSLWHRQGELPKEFFEIMGEGGWYGFEAGEGRWSRRSALREALLSEELAKFSPGAGIAALAHADLGMMGVWLFGADALKQRCGAGAVSGRTVMCLGNTERQAGSDVASVAMSAVPAPGGWRLSGTKSYVTNGAVADLAVVTAVTDPEGPRNNRMSMFLADLNSEGVQRTRLNKQVWVPSDLTRIEFQDVFVAEDHMLGPRGRGLQQILSIFTRSRVPIAALTLGTAVGAFDLAVNRAVKRTVFGRRIADFQAKSFEIADLHAGIEAARLMIWKACWKMDQGVEFREEASIAKYLAVGIARKASAWAADMFGAASVVHEHPIHKFPMDAWASSLGEGTQDVQKLIIFREVIKRYE
jgi:alkylation response protein AidB-like acyl-CoA dehydrogenase